MAKRVIILAVTLVVFTVGAVFWKSDIVFAESPGKIGVVFSESSEKYSLISRPGGTYNNQKVAPKDPWSPIIEKEQKLYALLAEQGFQVEKVSDQDLKNASTLRRYDALVFAHTVLMSKEQRYTVKEYIRNGGGALFIYGTARNEVTKFPKEGQMDLTPLIYDTKTWIWEWDNLTEVFQSAFVNDVVVKNTKLTQSSSHPIIQHTLRTSDQSKLSIENNRSMGEWIEVIKPYAGAKVTSLLTNEAFKDVSPNSSLKSFIDVLSAANVTTGYPDGTFRPNNFVTRTQFATFVDRALHVME
ncbi:S-layer homology domain-containing protein [Bacillus songklensis]|uniref:S-layer homology domain-containing protein n=1 Tax=Bacillus songklensis TaxID=1069116 RepID=A0ABV8B7K0_9BACI